LLGSANCLPVINEKHNLLEPENLYGFEMEEFLAVLPHLQGIQ